MTPNERRSDSEMLKTEQYHNSGNLSARIRLHQLYSTNKQDMWDWYFDHVLAIAPKQAKVLEVGTGRGDMWKVNAHRIPQGWELTLTDFSAGMIVDNQAHLGEISKRMTYQTVDVQELPFEDDSFDVIFANYMLYHVPNIPQAVRELRRVLKPDGVLFAGTNGNNHMLDLYRIAGEYDNVDDWMKHFSHTFSLQNGAELLGASFKNVAMHEFESDLFVTDVQAIVDYIESMISLDGKALLEVHEEDLRAKLNQQIVAKGGILIKKETGFFIATGA